MSKSGFLFDANVWVPLAFRGHPDHAIATDALRAAAAQSPAYFCRSTQQSVLRLLTTPALHRMCGLTVVTNQDALAILSNLLTLPGVSFRDEPPGIVPVWHRYGALPSASPKVWMDAYLSAFAVTAGLEVVTFDRGFAKFDGVELRLLRSAGATSR